MEDHADQLVGRDLHACGADNSLFLITKKRLLKTPICRIRARAEAHRVLHRHRRPLRHVLQHEVRGVAQQRDASLDPV
ncbi:MAG TPA: hypothetical protein VNZ59_10605, partial [Burkholderiales bacterium]|nr:hypothetical protein [Burkholderiales bacterium]